MTVRASSDPKLERRRQTNRAWKHKRRDGQCEAVTSRGTRCPFVGQYDGLTGEVRCGIHAQ